MRAILIAILIAVQACTGTLSVSPVPVLPTNTVYQDDYLTALAVFTQEGYELNILAVEEFDAPYIKRTFSGKVVGKFTFSGVLQIATQRPRNKIRSTIVHEMVHAAQLSLHSQTIHAEAWTQKEWHNHAGFFEGAVNSDECTDDNATLFCRAWRATGWSVK